MSSFIYTVDGHFLSFWYNLFRTLPNFKHNKYIEYCILKPQIHFLFEFIRLSKNIYHWKYILEDWKQCCKIYTLPNDSERWTLSSTISHLLKYWILKSGWKISWVIEACLFEQKNPWRLIQYCEIRNMVISNDGSLLQAYFNHTPTIL